MFSQKVNALYSQDGLFSIWYSVRQVKRYLFFSTFFCQFVLGINSTSQYIFLFCHETLKSHVSFTKISLCHPYRYCYMPEVMLHTLDGVHQRLYTLDLTQRGRVRFVSSAWVIMLMKTVPRMSVSLISYVSRGCWKQQRLTVCYPQSRAMILALGHLPLLIHSAPYPWVALTEFRD